MKISPFTENINLKNLYLTGAIASLMQGYFPALLAALWRVTPITTATLFTAIVITLSFVGAATLGGNSSLVGDSL